MNQHPIKIISTSLFIALVLIASLAHVTADMYVPSLPVIVKDLKGSVSLALHYLGHVAAKLSNAST